MIEVNDPIADLTIHKEGKREPKKPKKEEEKVEVEEELKEERGDIEK